MDPRVATYRDRLDDIHGWFGSQDLDLFDWFLSRQSEPGDILEMGPYLGRSSVLLGYYLRSTERLVVCDLFGSASGEDRNDVENAGYRRPLREAFEANYGRFHPEPALVLQCPTAELGARLLDATMRFVHVDASHLYERVKEDIGTAKRLLTPQGLLVCDDYRSPHTPGTAAAVWEAMLNAGLHPVCVSQQKLYGTFGDPGPWLRALESTPPPGQVIETQSVFDQELHLVSPAARQGAAGMLARISSRSPRPLARLMVSAYLARRAPGWVLREPMLAAQLGSRSGVDFLRLIADDAPRLPRA